MWQTEREKTLWGKTSMDVRRVTKRRRRPEPEPEQPGSTDDAVAAEMAKDDANERKLTDVSLRQVFLFHQRKPEKDEKVIPLSIWLLVSN